MKLGSKEGKSQSYLAFTKDDATFFTIGKKHDLETTTSLSIRFKRNGMCCSIASMFQFD